MPEVVDCSTEEEEFPKLEVDSGDLKELKDLVHVFDVILY